MLLTLLDPRSLCSREAIRVRDERARLKEGNQKMKCGGILGQRHTPMSRRTVECVVFGRLHERRSCLARLESPRRDAVLNKRLCVQATFHVQKHGIREKLGEVIARRAVVEFIM